MSSTGSRSGSDRTYVIDAGMDKGASNTVDSRSQEVTYELNRHVGTFTRAWYAVIKNGSNGGAGPENPEFTFQ